MSISNADGWKLVALLEGAVEAKKEAERAFIIETFKAANETPTGKHYLDLHRAKEIRAEVARVKAERKAKEEFEAAKASPETAYFKSEEFRNDVIAELIAEGVTKLQAEGRTRDQVRLFAEAARLGLM